MLKNLKKQQQGFTIIEVMIVLVIAAVILLIVFLAVPALQRNSRNTQRKNDVASIMAAVNEWSTNNNNAMPTDTSFLTGVKLGFYSSSNVSLIPNTNPNSNNAITVAVTLNALGTQPIENRLVIAIGAKCNGTNVGGSDPGKNAIAAVYGIEGGSGPQSVCTEG